MDNKEYLFNRNFVINFLLTIFGLASVVELTSIWCSKIIIPQIFFA
jgi:hypothetical protein